MTVGGHTGETKSPQGTLPGGFAVRENYDEIFEIEIECWCYGFIKFPGELNGPLVHRVIKELAPVLRTAIDHNYAFDIHHVVDLIRNATAGIVPDKELCFSLLAQLPAPHLLNEEAQCVLGHIVDQAEQRYSGVLERMERRWKTARAGRPEAEDKFFAQARGR